LSLSWKKRQLINKVSIKIKKGIAENAFLLFTFSLFDKPPLKAN